MRTLGFDNPLYVLPFDHRGSFETKMFGWHGDLNAAQTAQIAAAKQVTYDGFKAAIAGGMPKAKAGILVDERPRRQSKALSVLPWAERISGSRSLITGQRRLHAKQRWPKLRDAIGSLRIFLKVRIKPNEWRTML